MMGNRIQEFRIGVVALAIAAVGGLLAEVVAVGEEADGRHAHAVLPGDLSEGGVRVEHCEALPLPGLVGCGKHRPLDGGDGQRRGRLRRNRLRGRACRVRRRLRCHTAACGEENEERAEQGRSRHHSRASGLHGGQSRR